MANRELQILDLRHAARGGSLDPVRQADTIGESVRDNLAEAGHCLDRILRHARSKEDLETLAAVDRIERLIRWGVRSAPTPDDLGPRLGRSQSR